MKIVSLRSLSREAPTLTSSVVVTHQNVVIGIYRPLDAPPEPDVPWTAAEINATVAPGDFSHHTTTSVTKAKK